ncbi:DUF3060 domain-containing protein [Brevundimonas intermedia]|jgi:hypothetical protein|uniref:DUF3060 domain-containing protein n=1 Tax=Brevundimonas intermedia TaxID=74315 RepID=UPI0032091B3D
MTLVALAVLTAIAQGQAGVSSRNADKIKISGVGQTSTIACEGRSVHVEGAGNVLTFTGDCAELELAGTDNQITIELQPNARIIVDGASQIVRWRSTGQPRQSVQGVDNQVIRLQD